MPRYAISDIHGCPETFTRLLTELALGREDELFLLGDYIDRGPDSAGVLRRIRQLEADGYRVRCLRGNHEQMLLDAHANGSPPWDYRPAPSDAAATLEWMAHLPHYLETPGYLLVHAGLNFRAGNPLEDTHAMLWARYWEGEMDLNWLGDRTVVYGHTPAEKLDVARSIEYMQFTHRVCIDSGCAMRAPGMGYLTALNLDTREGTFLRRID